MSFHDFVYFISLIYCDEYIAYLNESAFSSDSTIIKHLWEYLCTYFTYINIHRNGHLERLNIISVILWQTVGLVVSVVTKDLNTLIETSVIRLVVVTTCIPFITEHSLRDNKNNSNNPQNLCRIKFKFSSQYSIVVSSKSRRWPLMGPYKVHRVNKVVGWTRQRRRFKAARLLLSSAQ